MQNGSLKKKTGNKTGGLDSVDSIRYKGETVGESGVRNGRGKYVFPHGGQLNWSYDGSWANGIKEGSGRFAVPGSVYSGSFISGEMTGTAEKVWDDGRKYIGEFRDGEMCGRGKWTSSAASMGRGEGETFEGYFDDNKRSGLGYLQRGSGASSGSHTVAYTGEFSAHKFHGCGSYLSEGRFVVTNGHFESNVLQGSATVSWDRLATMSVAAFRYGVPTGEGALVCADGSYDLQARWGEDSLPLACDVGGYMTATVDRTEVSVGVGLPRAVLDRDRNRCRYISLLYSEIFTILPPRLKTISYLPSFISSFFSLPHVKGDYSRRNRRQAKGRER